MSRDTKTNTAKSSAAGRRTLPPLYPSTKLTLMFHLSGFATLTLGILLLACWFLIFPDPTTFAEIKFLFATQMIVLTAGILIVLGIAALILSVRFSHRVSGPMVAISRHVDSLIQGQYDQRVTLRQTDEFHPLAHKLNELAETLKKKNS